MRYVQGLLLVALAFYAIDAQSVTYYWKGGNSWADYGTLSNWSTESATGADATALPGEDDSLATQTCYFDLGGKTWEIGTTSPGSAHSYQFTNGVFRILKYSEPKGRSTHVYNGAIVVCSSDGMGLGWWDAAPLDEYVHFGGVLDYSAAKQINAHNWNLFISSGGTAKLCRKWVDGLNRTHTINNSGTLDLSMGFYASQNSSGVKWNFTQNAGALILGGPFSNQGYANELNLSLNGGSVVLKEGASFFATSVVIGENKTVAFECDFDFDMASSIEFMTGANLVKTGDGILLMDAIPDSLTLQGGGVRTFSAVPSVVFAGGSLELVAETKSISCIQSVSAGEGAKAKISLRNLYLLPPGEYTIVASGNALGQSDYEFDIDASVSASVSVKDDGSVVLTVIGLAEDQDSIVWNPQSEGKIWDANAFGNGRTVIFNGEESGYTGKITVKGTPKPLQVVVSGDKNYSFLGDAVDTIYVSKSGEGTLFIDGGGFTGRYFTLTGGALSFKNCEYIAAEEPLKISISGSTRLSAHKNPDLKLFDFRFNSDSTNWESTEEYTSIQTTETITNFIVKASPRAPDKSSLSGKSVYVMGMFYVPEEETGEWSFKGIYDDGIILSIDGTQLFKTANYQDTKTVSVNLAEGWHKFEIRAYDGSGEWGHDNCITAKKPSEANYVAFHEQNFNMNWYDTEIDSRGFPSSIPVELTISDGSSLVFDAPGYDIKSLSLGEGCTVSIDPYTVPANKTFLIVKDAAVKAVLKGKIQESLGATGTVVETEDGLAWEMEAVFNNVNITDLEDKDGWMIGIVPGTDEDITISGEGVAPVMDGETRTFNSITVADGASFTVAATREIPALTLNAGTAFSVVKNALESQEFLYSECIPCENDVLIGQMDPMDSIEVLSGFSAITTGTYWGGKNQPYEHVIAKSINNGKSLHVQFKRYDDGYVKCAIVEIWNENGNIRAKLVEARYWQTTDSNNVTHDFINDDGAYNQSPGTKANTDSSEGYGVRELKFSVPSRNVGIKVTAAGAFSTAGDGAVIVNVEEGCVLDLSEVEVSCGAKIVKHGDGAIVFGAENLPQALNIQEGILALQPGVSYDLSGIELGASVQVAVWQDDAVRVAYPVAGENGTVIYYARGTYIGVGGWNDLDNWAGRTLPLAGDVVRLPESGSMLSLDDLAAVMPSKIVLSDGAVLKVLADCMLPEVELAPTASFIVGNNEDRPEIKPTCVAAPIGSYRVEGETVLLPTVMIATNSYLTTTGNMRFKNIRLELYGKLRTSENGIGDIRLGYAEEGETTYFGFYSDGGSIKSRSSSSDVNAVRIGIMNPEKGGFVRPIGNLYFRKVSCDPGGWADWRNLHVGTDNSYDIPFNVIVDGGSTLFSSSWDIYFGGAAKVRFVNGATLSMNSAMINHGTSVGALIQDYAQLEFDGEGSNFVFAHAYKGANFKPATDGYEQIAFKNGAQFIQHYAEGNAKAVLTFYNAIFTIPRDYRKTDLFRGVKAVSIAAGTSLTIKGANVSQGATWDRLVKVSDIPFVGDGSLMLSNEAMPNLMEVTIVNGNNSATGNATASENAKLLFADGANWAGTVVSGNVALTNLSEEAETPAASVKFAKLDLAADFPVRVWRNEDGTLVSDTLNVGEYLDSGVKGGKIALVAMFDGEFAPRESFVLGTIPKGAQLPPVGRGWTAKSVEIEGDDENVMVKLERNSGFTITIR